MIFDRMRPALDETWKLRAEKVVTDIRNRYCKCSCKIHYKCFYKLIYKFWKELLSRISFL